MRVINHWEANGHMMKIIEKNSKNTLLPKIPDTKYHSDINSFKTQN